MIKQMKYMILALLLFTGCVSTDCQLRTAHDVLVKTQETETNLYKKAAEDVKCIFPGAIIEGIEIRELYDKDYYKVTVFYYQNDYFTDLRIYESLEKVNKL